MDRHFPARPSELITHNDFQDELDYVGELFGDELVTAIKSCYDAGSCLLQLELDLDQRLRIVDLQIHSPETPEPLRIACQQMIESNQIVIEPIIDASDVEDWPPAV